jgi:hypothetical protein
VSRAAEVPEEAVLLALGALGAARRLRQIVLHEEPDPGVEVPADAVFAVLGLLAWGPRLERLLGPELPPCRVPEALPTGLLR